MIVNHLSQQQNSEDDFSGIIFGTFEKVFQDFTESINDNLGYLISKGAVKELTDNKGNIIYQLSINPQDLSEYLNNEG